MRIFTQTGAFIKPYFGRNFFTRHALKCVNQNDSSPTCISSEFWSFLYGESMHEFLNIYVNMYVTFNALKCANLNDSSPTYISSEFWGFLYGESMYELLNMYVTVLDSFLQLLS